MRDSDVAKDTAAITRGGILSFLSLQAKDRLVILTRVLHISYKDCPGRKLVVDITSDSSYSPCARVSQDSYNALPINHHNYPWVLPDGAEITLLGAYRLSNKTEFNDELYYGMGLRYTWREVAPTFTGPIHEVGLLRDGLRLRVFSADLNRPATIPNFLPSSPD